MDKAQVIARLCSLASKVGSKVYHDELAHDCFCYGYGGEASFQFHPEILSYIENAVNEYMKTERSA